MKRAVIGVTLLALVFTGSGCSTETEKSVETKKPVDSKKPQELPTSPFEQRKAQILKGLDQQIAMLQKEGDCIKAAKSEDDLRECVTKRGMSSGRKALPTKTGKGRPGVTSGQAASPDPGDQAEPDGETPE
jgi:hypothetical protein